MAGKTDKEAESFLAGTATGWIAFQPFYSDKSTPYLDFVLKVVETVEKADGTDAEYTSMTRVQVFGSQAKKFSDIDVGESVTASGRIITQARSTRNQAEETVNLLDERGKPVFEHVITIDDKKGELVEARLGAMPAARGRGDGRGDSRDGGGRGGRSGGGRDKNDVRGQTGGRSQAGGRGSRPADAGESEAGAGRGGRAAGGRGARR